MSTKLRNLSCGCQQKLGCKQSYQGETNKAIKEKQTKYQGGTNKEKGRDLTQATTS